MILDYRQYLTKIPAPLKEKGRDYASAVAAIFMTIFFLIFAIKPTAIAIAELLGEIKARENINRQLQEKINQIMAAQNNYNRIYPDIVYVDQALPTNTQIASFVQHMEANRTLSQISLDNLTYAPLPLKESQPRKDSQAQDIPFVAKMEGNYPHIKEFLDKITQYRRITYIEEIELNQNMQKGDENKPVAPSLLNFSFKGKTFYFRQ